MVDEALELTGLAGRLKAQPPDSEVICHGDYISRGCWSAKIATEIVMRELRYGGFSMGEPVTRLQFVACDVSTPLAAGANPMEHRDAASPFGTDGIQFTVSYAFAPLTYSHLLHHLHHVLGVQDCQGCQSAGYPLFNRALSITCARCRGPWRQRKAYSHTRP